MTSRNGVEFAWELSQASMAQLSSSANAFQRRLVSMLVHTIALGLVFIHTLNGFTIPYLSATARELANTVILEALTEPKSKTSLSIHCRSEKLFPLRLSGPSMTFIGSSSLNLDLSRPITIFQLAIWRAFAFGDQAKLSALVLLLPLASTTTINDDPGFATLHAIILPWFGEKAMYNLPAYGQYMVSKSQVLSTLHSLWEFAKWLSHPPSQSQSQSQSQSHSHSASLTPLPFSTIYNWFVSKRLHSLKSHGLIPWLLICDIAEFGGCALPTISDLALHLHAQISQTTPRGFSGPNSAIEAVTFWSSEAEAEQEGAKRDSTKWTRQELEDNLRVVWEMITDPQSPVEEIRRYREKAREAQGRELGVADLEHMLCKISRQMPKVVGAENKRRTEERRRKKRGKVDEDEAEDEKARENGNGETPTRKKNTAKKPKQKRSA